MARRVYRYADRDWPDPRNTRAWRALRDRVVAEEPTCQLRIAGVQGPAVEDEEGFADHRRRALVAVHERMVARDPEGVGRGKIGSIRIAVGHEISGPRHRAFERAGIADAFAATMLRKLLGMRCHRHVERDPEPIGGHGAISRVRAAPAGDAP